MCTLIGTTQLGRSACGNSLPARARQCLSSSGFAGFAASSKAANSFKSSIVNPVTNFRFASGIRFSKSDFIPCSNISFSSFKVKSSWRSLSHSPCFRNNSALSSSNFPAFCRDSWRSFSFCSSCSFNFRFASSLCLNASLLSFSKYSKRSSLFWISSGVNSLGSFSAVTSASGVTASTVFSSTIITDPLLEFEI